MIVRAATAADIPAVADVLEVSGESAAWPGLPGWPYVEHLVARGRVPLAIDDTGLAIGMAGSIEVGRPDVRFLTDLFVRPDRQDHGVGRALLAMAFDGTTERLTFSSADPRALGTYIRAGLRPWWPLLYLSVDAGVLATGGTGTAAADTGVAGTGPAATGAGGAPATITTEVADVATTASWSQTWTGMDRSVDFDHYARLPDGAGHLVREDGAVAAVAWSNRTRRDAWRAVDHVTIAPGAEPVAVTIAALRAALGEAPGLVMTIPGPHPAVPWLLERGARISDRDQYCATDPALLDADRILPSAGFL